MGLSRREFLKLQCLTIPQVRQLAFALAATLSAQVARADRRTLSIVQGLTDATTTQISIVVPISETFEYDVFGGPQGEAKLTQRQIFRHDSDWAIDRLVVTQLVPHYDYVLTVTNSQGQQIDQRVFRSLDPSGTQGRFAFVSCINDQYTADEEWKALCYDEPQVIFFVGDTAYTDRGPTGRKIPDPAQLWRRHAETRNKIPIYFAPRLIPILAVWDDHDFGGDDSDRRYPYAQESREIFKSFFPQDSSVSSSLVEGPGVACAYQAFGQRFFLLDSRTGRTEKGAKEGTHWGLDQEKWIVEQARSVNVPSYLFNGSGYFGAYHFGESVEKHHPNSLKRMGEELGKLPQVFVLASGDIHFSEVMTIEKEWLGYPTRELVSSSIQSRYVSYMDKIYWNKRRQCSVACHSFMLVETAVDPQGSLTFKATARGAHSRVLFEHQATISK